MRKMRESEGKGSVQGNNYETTGSGLELVLWYKFGDDILLVEAPRDSPYLLRKIPLP